MKFVYIDESGNDGNSQVFLMVGLLIDAYSLRKTTESFSKLFREFIKVRQIKSNEIKASFLFKSKNANQTAIRDFVSDVTKLAVKDTEIYSISIIKEFFIDPSKQSYTADLNVPDAISKNYWLASAMYICSFIQRKMKKKDKNKGNTIVIFDNNQIEVPKLSDYLYKPDPWFNDLYLVPTKGKSRRKKRQSDNFNQIINTAFPIKSEHSYIIQAADILCYVLRRHLELKDKDSKKKWNGEKSFIDGLAEEIISHKIKFGRLPKNSICAQYYKAIKPKNWKL